MEWGALEIARLQFAMSVSFHIILAAFTIGLALFLALMEGLWLWRKERHYWVAYEYWLKIYALNVAVGIVSGVVLEYQFGTNWSVLSSRAGAVIGPLMFYEVLIAFFLEAGFLGIMLFGAKKVGPGLHFFATCMVALGSLFSAFWILSANSWMHTPAGFRIDEAGLFLPEDWLAVIFNPSFPYRFAHMTVATVLASACMIGAAGAWHLLRDRNNRAARVMFSYALWILVVLGPAQAVIGDLHGLNTLEHQPQKVAAMEASWKRPAEGDGQPLVLFAWPDQGAQINRFELSIPHVGSLYLRHDWTGTITSLSEFDADEIPFVPFVFFAFRIMVGIGILLIALGVAGAIARYRGTLYEARLLQRCMVLAAPAGFVALLAGWVVTETGRQPYTVYGLLRTAESVSAVPREMVVSSLFALFTLYVLIFFIGNTFLLRSLRQPPNAGEEGPTSEMAERIGEGAKPDSTAAQGRETGG